MSGNNANASHPAPKVQALHSNAITILHSYVFCLLKTTQLLTNADVEAYSGHRRPNNGAKYSADGLCKGCVESRTGYAPEFLVLSCNMQHV